MQVAKLDLSDLSPAPAEFKLSGYPDHTFRLGAFTLRVELWVKKTLGKETLHRAIATQDLELILPIGWHVLDQESKKLFSDMDAFAEAIVTFQDRGNFSSAVMETFGLSQPVLEKIAKDLEEAAKKEKALAEEKEKLTGADSTTNAPTPTAGPSTNS